MVVRYHINNSPFDFDYHLSGHTIAEKSACKDLGIFTTYNLKWKSHYKHITSRAYKMLGLLRRVFNEVSYVSSKRLLYISLVRSQLLYCSPLWRPYLISDIGQLESVQRRATRYISKCSSHNYKERLTDINLLPLMMIYEISDIIFFVKCIKNKISHFMISDFVCFSSSHTRQATFFKLRHSKATSNASRYSYFNRLPRLWNSLPCIDLDLSVATIKYNLKHFFWQHFITKFDPENVCSYHFLCPCNKCSMLPVTLNFDTL